MSTSVASTVKKVLIIGGGMSGIAAASRLCEKGIRDIVTLEAEDRLGGRVYTIDLENGNSINKIARIEHDIFTLLYVHNFFFS